MSIHVENTTVEDDEEYTPESKKALYWSRGLYIVAGLCFVVALVVLINSAVIVQGYASTDTTTLADAMVGGAKMLHTVFETLLYWLVLVTAGLLSWVTGVLVKTFWR